MALSEGVDRGSGGEVVAMTATGTIVYAEGGVPVTATGELRTTIITGAPPAGSITVAGLSYASDGTIQVTTDAIGLVDKGIAYTAARVLCHTTNAVTSASTRAYLPGIGTALVDASGRVHVS